MITNTVMKIDFFPFRMKLVYKNCQSLSFLQEFKRNIAFVFQLSTKFPFHAWNMYRMLVGQMAEMLYRKLEAVGFILAFMLEICRIWSVAKSSEMFYIKILKKHGFHFSSHVSWNIYRILMGKITKNVS